MKKLPRTFYDRDPRVVAQDLLGKYLIHNTGTSPKIGKIVETEAYLGPHDLAAHSAKGKTKRTAVMFGPPGHLYVYLIYGMYYCVNVVTEQEGLASAVLIRALEPIVPADARMSGPGLLCKAMDITQALNGHDLLQSPCYISEGKPPEKKIVIVKRPRIGVDYAKHWAKRLLRFYIKGNPFVSKL